MRAPRRARSIDHASIGRAVSYPGIDPREWISFATVDQTTDAAPDQVVSVDADDGQVYVSCTLKPSDTPVRCRVGMLSAGPGEAVYFPFVSGDEVLVALPQGDPRAGATIIARLNNSYDPFPATSVAGADPALNSFGMIRTRSALTIESGATIMLRSAAAGAFLRLDAKGNCTLRDGSSGTLQMGAEVFGYQSGPGDVFLQLDLNEQRFNLKIGQASLLLAGSLAAAAAAGTPSGSFLMVPGSLTVSGGGAPPNTTVEHVLTTEAFANLLYQEFTTLSAAFLAAGAAPQTGGTIAAIINAWLLSGFAPAIGVAGSSSLLPSIGLAIQAVFATAPPKLPPTTPAGQLSPSIGCPAFLSG